MYATSPFTSFVDTFVGPDETHTYRVNAFDATGNRSNRSERVTGITAIDTTPPTQPLNLTATVT